MTKNDLSLLIEVMRSSKVPYSILCTETWNGFEKGVTYQTELARNGQLFATDKDGIPTAINSVHAFFEPVKALPTEEEKAASERAENAAILNRLGSLLTQDRPTFERGQLVEWIPGMCNRRLPSEKALMYVLENVEPLRADPTTTYANPNGAELVNLRVAAMALSSRDDEDCIVEVLIDSRRVRLWGAANGQKAG